MQPASSSRTRGAHSNRNSSSRASPAPLEAEDQPSPGKRQKLGYESAGPSKLKSAQSSSMYSFGKPVIDLTSSPEGKGKASPHRGGVARPATGGVNSGPKKLNVKNLKISSRSNPEQYRDKIWKQVEDALNILFGQESKPFSLEELYRGVENVCRQKEEKVLFERLRKRCTEEIKGSVLRPLSAKADEVSSAELLRLVTESWATWRRQMNTVRSIFYFMDRSYLLRSQTEPSIDELSISLFRDYVFSNKSLQPKALEGICDCLTEDRVEEDGGDGRKTLFKEAIGMSQTLVVYAGVVEPELLKSSQKYFLAWQEEQAPKLTLPEYVEAVISLMSREKARCEVYGLEESTRRDLQQQIHSFLLSTQVAKLTGESEVADLMERNQFQTLTQLFDLLQLIDQVLGLQKPLEAYVTARGSSIVFDQKREAEMIPRLLQFKAKLDTIMEQCFHKNQDLSRTLREGFNVFMNKTDKANSHGTGNNKPGEMVAKYVDLILRGGSKAIPQIALDDSLKTSNENDEDADNDDADEDEQINKQLDQVLELFRFVHGKAVFEAFYKKALAKRLLMNRSASADAEKSMLTRLKAECGPNFTHNLEQMFKDIEMARDENSGFKNVMETRSTKPEVDLSVNVCSAAAWPTYDDVDIEIPQSIQKATAEYEKYYKSKYSGRKLQWKHAQSHCQMSANFPKGRKEIIVSGFQAIVMLYFNEKSDNEPVPYSELQQATKISHDELKRTLQSLACARYRVLSKSPKGKDVNSTDKFIVNLNFSDPKYRIKINQIQLKETKEENKQTHERVAADRQYETQAAIVRIMKSKKTIKHPLLVAEVINATKSRGAVDAEDIKKQIEKLIDKDYMERLENDPMLYEYIA